MKIVLGVMLSVLGSLMIMALPAHAAVWYVHWNGPWGGDGSSWSKAFRNIHPAIEAGADFDQIWVAGSPTGQARYELGSPLVVNKAVKL
jgi:hypothetical protein